MTRRRLLARVAAALCLSTVAATAYGQFGQRFFSDGTGYDLMARVAKEYWKRRVTAALARTNGTNAK
jgi:hypothetical protein